MNLIWSTVLFFHIYTAYTSFFVGLLMLSIVKTWVLSHLCDHSLRLHCSCFKRIKTTIMNEK